MMSALKLPRNRSTNALAARSTENVGAGSQSNRPFCISTDCDARHAQTSGFFLNSARVGNNQRGVFHKAEKIEVTQRVDHPYAGAAFSPCRDFTVLKIEVRFKPVLLNLLLSPWVSRKNYHFVDAPEALKYLEESAPIVHVGGTVQSEEHVSLVVRRAVCGGNL